MVRLVYILLFLCFTTNVMQGNNGLNTSLINQLPSTDISNSKYKIYTSNNTIYINQIEAKSYIMVFDSSGRNVYKQTTNYGSLSIPVYSKGVYILRIQRAKEIFTQRILVK